MALCAGFVGLIGDPAEARVFVGIGVPLFGPAFYPPPVYYPPPPVYYPPPPVVYAPPSQSYMPQHDQSGQACYAGAYSCPMDHPVATGSSCYCLGNGGQRIWGRSN
ncbi:MAG TPA: hypothetical protein VGH36_00040 [Acetobacteraceae bacterium]